MKLIGTQWVIQYPEGTTTRDGRETENAAIATEMLVELEKVEGKIVPKDIKRDINDLNWNLVDSPWKAEPFVENVPEDIPLGSHLFSCRRLYWHHGIYVGNQKVVHYSGLRHGIRDLLKGNKGCPVEEVSLTEFANGNGYSIKLHPNPKHNGEQVAARARSKVGENHYCVFANNCEHFCEWCINGDHHSEQVKLAVAVGGPTLGTVAGLAARGIVAASGTVVGVSGPGVMSGLASVGGLVGGGAVAGVGVLGGIPSAAMASLVNQTVLKDNSALEKNERDSRAIGRVASYVSAGVGTVGGIGAISAFGSVAGLSGAGISSGLASIGSIIGGGMVAGTVIVTAAPVVLAAAGGYGTYRLVKFSKGADRLVEPPSRRPT